MQRARTPSTPTPINGANAFLISGWLGERVRPIQSSSCGIDGAPRVCTPSVASAESGSVTNTSSG